MRKKIYLLILFCSFIIARGYSQQCTGIPGMPGSSAGTPAGSPGNPGLPDCKDCGGSQDTIGNDFDFGFDIFGIGSWDPNLIVTPLGFDSARWVSVNDKMGITIYFENDPNLATAPVHDAYIYYKLSSKEDAASFRLGSFGFNGMIFTVPNNLNFYQTRLDLRDSLGLYVDVTAGINVTNNTAFWIFQSIDPLTNQPPLDPMTGFLPVKDTSLTALNDTVAPDGEGFVNFTIEPSNTAQTRDTIFSQAQIVFDTNDTIQTNIEFNTIDALPPSSTISADSVINNMVLLHFQAADDTNGCGVKEYDLYVSQDSSNYVTYLTHATDTIISFACTEGSTYHFFSLATDNVGNREALKGVPDTSITVSVVNTIAVVHNASNVSCHGDSTANIVLNVTGGLPPYSYLWSNGATTSQLINIPSGTYIVTVTDSEFIARYDTIVITQPAASLSSVLNATASLCLGDSSGTATVLATNGTAPYQFVWNTNAVATTISNLPPGTYTCTVTDANGCIKTNFVTINHYDTASASIAQTNITCGATATGTITVNPTSGTAPFLFAIDSGNFGTSNSFNSLLAGQYIVHIKDSHACNVANYTVNITENAPLLPISSAVNNLCFGGKSGTINLTSFGGTAPYTYLWSNGKTTEDLINLIANTYTCTITDINGCTAIHSQIVTQGAKITMTFTKTNATAPLFNNGTATCFPANGFPTYRYTWNTTPSKTTQTVTGLTAGVYVVTVKDNKKCARNGSVTILAARMGVVSNIESTLSANPNPSNGVYTISGEFNYDGIVEYDVYDVTSRLLVHNTVEVINGLNEFTLDISDKPHGIYILYVHDIEGPKTLKLIFE